MELKKHRPIVYKYYDYLKQNCMGKKNGIKAEVLAGIMEITYAEQKRIIKEINEAEDLDKLISTCNATYMCETEEECLLAMSNTFKTALTLLNKAKQMSKKFGKQGQFKLHLGKDYKDFITVFEE